MQRSEQGKLNFSKDPLAKYERTHSQATNIIWASTKKDNRKAWRMKIYVKNMVTKPENPSLNWAFLGCNPQKNRPLQQLPPTPFSDPPFLSSVCVFLSKPSSAAATRPIWSPREQPTISPLQPLESSHLRGLLKNSRKIPLLGWGSTVGLTY